MYDQENVYIAITSDVGQDVNVYIVPRDWFKENLLNVFDIMTDIDEETYERLINFPRLELSRVYFVY